MSIGIRIQKAANHSLIWHLRPCGVGLEEIHAFFAQGYGDLDAVFLQHELIRRRKKIVDDFEPAERFIGVFSNGLHRAFCLCAKSRRQ